MISQGAAGICAPGGRAAFPGRASLALEKAALHQQLTIYHRTQKHPRLQTGDRVFWILLRRLWSGWKRALIVVSPETVIAWHRRGFKLLWRRRSRRGSPGRPRIPREHRAFIRRMSGDHPEWGEDRTTEELAAKFGIHHSGSTIRRYRIQRTDGPRKTQTWCTFIQNHSNQVWACDFLTQHTAFFAVVSASQAIHGIPDSYPELKEAPPTTGRLLALPLLGGLIHDYRLAA